MKKIGMLLVAIAIAVMLSATPVLAASMAIGPPSVEFSVPANGSTEVEFYTSDFSGKLNISLENIPLKVEPTTIAVKDGDKVILTFYGDESLGSQVFDGEIRFLAIIGDSVGMGIKVKAKVTVEGPSLPPKTEEPVSPEPIASPAPPELSLPSTQETSTQETPSEAAIPPTPPLPSAPKATEFPILPVSAVGVAVVLIIGIVLVVRLTRRRGY